MSRADALHRLREIAAERRRLDDEEAALIAQLDDGADEGDGTLNGAAILGPHLRPVKTIAPMMRMSEKTLRKIAPEIGAEVRIGGRVFVDERILTAHIEGKILPLSSPPNGKILPNSSKDAPKQICDSDCEVIE